MPDTHHAGLIHCRYLSQTSLGVPLHFDHALGKGRSVFSVVAGEPYTWKEASNDSSRLTVTDLAAMCTHKGLPNPPTKAEKAKRIIEYVHRRGLGTLPLMGVAGA